MKASFSACGWVKTPGPHTWVVLESPRMRPVFDSVWMNLARDLAARATCGRAQVGCVVVSSDNQRVLSIGYNGSYKGGPNGCDRDEPGNCGCLHAEDNACVKLDYNDPVEKKLYCTVAPCAYCAKRIVNAGIGEVIYLREYRKTDGLEILRKAGKKVRQMEEGVVHFEQDRPKGEVREQLRAPEVQGPGRQPAGPDVDPGPRDSDPVQARKKKKAVPPRHLGPVRRRKGVR